MLQKILQHVRQGLIWLRQAISSPRDELDRWERAIRFAYDLGRFGARQLRQDRAPMMAAALSFRTLFGLLPVLVVSMVLVKAFKGVGAFETLLNDFIQYLGLHEIKPGDEATTDLTFGTWIEQLTSQAADTNLAAIGWVGLGVLLYSAISLMVTVENSFNIIYRANQGRHWFTRVPTYFTVLIGWPLAAGLTAYVAGSFTTWLEGAIAWGWVASVAPSLWSFVATWLLMIIIYRLVPSGNVHLRPAIIGALVAALLLEIGRRTMAAYLENAISLQQLYGSLGLVPLFMFWVYLMWLVVLFGLEVSAIVQKLELRRLEEIRDQDAVHLTEPAVLVTILVRIAEQFVAGKSLRLDQMLRDVHLPESIALAALTTLKTHELVHRVDGPYEAYSLAQAPDQIAVSRVLRLGFNLADGSQAEPPKWTIRLRDAQVSDVNGFTISDLIPSQVDTKTDAQVEGV